jgi:hypothetical protein
MKPVVFAVAVLLTASSAYAQHSTGNGSQSGSHYNLNLIGHNDCLGDDFTGSNRHVIAVLLNYNDGSQDGQLFSTLDKRNKIFLSPGTDFQVTDGSACDGAYFTLPSDVSSTYVAYARALGSPKDDPTGTITTCAVDTLGTDTTADDEIVCSTADNVLTLSRTKGGAPKFTNATDELLFLCADLNDNGTCENNEKVQLFDARYYSYFWDYDNNGLRLVQIRLYPVVN